MNFYVVNKGIEVGEIRLLAVSTASVLQIGDAEVITCTSMFDTPPEALQIGPLVPLTSESPGAT